MDRLLAEAADVSHRALAQRVREYGANRPRGVRFPRAYVRQLIAEVRDAELLGAGQCPSVGAAWALLQEVLREDVERAFAQEATVESLRELIQTLRDAEMLGAYQGGLAEKRFRDFVDRATARAAAEISARARDRGR